MLYVIYTVKALSNVSYGHIWLDVTVRIKFRAISSDNDCVNIFLLLSHTITITCTKESEEWLGSNNSNQKYFEDLVSETSVS